MLLVYVRHTSTTSINEYRSPYKQTHNAYGLIVEAKEYGNDISVFYPYTSIIKVVEK